MGYLAPPPPMPAPVVVTKDVGGFVSEYEAQTALYRATGREVRLHECRSACTLALGLPNVCVYPDSILKFHQAYDPRTRQTDFHVSQQLFDSYPAAVRARLGGLTRDYRVLRGSELIALGIKNCSEPRVTVAMATPQKPTTRPVQAETARSQQGSFFTGLMQGVLDVFDRTTDPARQNPEGIATGSPRIPAKAMTLAAASTEIPRPPRRPIEADAEIDSGSGRELEEADGIEVPAPRRRPVVEPSNSSRLAAVDLPRVISGAQPILPARFSAYTTSRGS